MKVENCFFVNRCARVLTRVSLQQMFLNAFRRGPKPVRNIGWKVFWSEAQRSDGETTDGWIPGMSLPSVSGRLSAPLRFALKSPVSSLASRQDEIANFVSRFHGILGGRASAREKRKRTRDSFFILWLSRVIPFPFLGLQADSR